MKQSANRLELPVFAGILYHGVKTGFFSTRTNCPLIAVIAYKFTLLPIEIPHNSCPDTQVTKTPTIL
jgi:hypothetical protein